MIKKDWAAFTTALGRTSLWVLTCIAFAFGLVGRAQADAPDSVLLVRIGELAREHQHVALLRLGNAVAHSKNPRVKAAYFVGRYYADPRTERDRLVRDFPSGFLSVNALYVVTPSVVPEHGTYLFAALADIARSGDADAIRKLELVASESDGGLGDFVGDALGTVAVKWPAKVLMNLGSLPLALADRLARDPVPWCDSHRNLASVRIDSARIEQLQREIRTSAGRC